MSEAISGTSGENGPHNLLPWSEVDDERSVWEMLGSGVLLLRLAAFAALRDVVLGLPFAVSTS